MDLVVEACGITKRLPKSETYRLASQFQRAAISVGFRTERNQPPDRALDLLTFARYDLLPRWRGGPNMGKKALEVRKATERTIRSTALSEEERSFLRANAAYEGSPYHERSPGDFGLRPPCGAPPRQDAVRRGWHHAAGVRR